MQVLLHLGLNKCASTYVQRTLESGHEKLEAAGTWYPWHAGQTGHYGLSKYYGFGPVDDSVSAVSLADYVSEARLAGSERLIVSSEYLSLRSPRGAAKLMQDARACGARVQAVLIGRAVEPWVRSLFNQYVKTVDGGRALPNIDAFVEQVLANRAIDLASRIGQWRDALGPDGLALHHMEEQAPLSAVIAPFTAFSGVLLTGQARARENPSLDPDRLHAIGVLRRQTPSPARERALSILLAGRGEPEPAPADFLEISPEMRRRLTEEIVRPAAGLPWQPLHVETREATAA